jgi:hypothetical protein
VCKVKEFLQLNRPYINIQIGLSTTATLYNSGADISCMSEMEFRKIPVDSRPSKIWSQNKSPCLSTGGTPLIVMGIYNLPVSLLGCKTEHPFRVIKRLYESVILGANFVNKHLLLYDPSFKQVKWHHENEWAISMIKIANETVIPEYLSQLLQVKGEAETANATCVIAEIFCPNDPYLTGGPGLMTLDDQGGGLMEVFNTGPKLITLCRGQSVGQVDNVQGQLLMPFDAEIVNCLTEEQWKKKQVQISRTPVTDEFRKMCRLEVPTKYKDDYRRLLAKHRTIFSLDKNEISYCSNFLHKLFMKMEEPVYVKQFKIPEAHHQYLQDQVREWLWLGIIQPSQSHYNSPVFHSEKKDGTKRVVQDFQSLNANIYVDKYSMQDMQECISEIGRAGSTIFTTLDFTSGFWQMVLDPKLRPYTAPGMGQFEWKVVSMGLASVPSAFQQLIEQVVKGIPNVVVYIDNLIIHSKMQKDHFRSLDTVFTRLAAHDLRVNLKKCVFGSNETSYLGFRLTKEGIFPGTDKLKAVKEAQPPKNIKQICQFLSLCNFFRGHIQNFAQITPPLTQLTKKDSGWKHGPLPESPL